MWLIVRLLASLIGFFWKNLSHYWSANPAGIFRELPYFVKTWKAKDGTVTKIRVGMPLCGPILFKLSPESCWDRWFKSVGLTHEIQSGDKFFDEQFYVTCDHPYFAGLLNRDAEAREKILKIYENGFKKIYSDGDKLWMESKLATTASQEDLQNLYEMKSALSELESQLPFRFKDPFYRTAFLVESIISAFVWYAVAGYFEYSINSEDYHLDRQAILFHGLKWAIAIGFIGLGSIIYFLRGSSRGHRIILESGIALAFAVPITGIQAVSDLNRALDNGPDRIEVKHVLRLEKREHRGRRNRRYYTYHVYLDSGGREPSSLTPNQIQITPSLFRKLNTGGKLEIRIAPGRLGHAWYRDFRAL